jgi:hypothetical protein
MRRGRVWIAGWLLLGCDRPEDVELRELRRELTTRAAQVEALQAELEARNAELAQARAESRRCQSEPPPPPPEGADGAEPPPGPSALNPSCSEGRCVVGRRELEALVRDTPTLTRLARVVPATQDGAVIGIKLFAIRPGTPLALLGFQNGDMVRSLAGIEIDSLAALSRASEVVLEQERWTIAAVREGEPFELTIETSQAAQDP